jgi:hypothetical protein
VDLDQHREIDGDGFGDDINVKVNPDYYRDQDDRLFSATAPITSDWMQSALLKTPRPGEHDIGREGLYSCIILIKVYIESSSNGEGVWRQRQIGLASEKGNAQSFA